MPSNAPVPLCFGAIEGSILYPLVESEVQAGRSMVCGIGMHGSVPLTCGIQPGSSTGAARVIFIPQINKFTKVAKTGDPTLPRAGERSRDGFANRRSFIHGNATRIYTRVTLLAVPEQI